MASPGVSSGRTASNESGFVCDIEIPLFSQPVGGSAAFPFLENLRLFGIQADKPRTATPAVRATTSDLQSAGFLKNENLRYIEVARYFSPPITTVQSRTRQAVIRPLRT